MVSTATLLSDTILFTRNGLINEITDPIASTRPAGEKFVMTSYPQRPVTYPIITVKGSVTDSRRVGQQSEQFIVFIKLEVKIWGSNEIEKNELFDDVFNYMKDNQFGTGSSTLAELHNFKLRTALDHDEDGEQGIKSKICDYRYEFFTSNG